MFYAPMNYQLTGHCTSGSTTWPSWKCLCYHDIRESTSFAGGSSQFSAENVILTIPMGGIPIAQSSSLEWQRWMRKMC